MTFSRSSRDRVFPPLLTAQPSQRHRCWKTRRRNDPSYLKNTVVNRAPGWRAVVQWCHLNVSLTLKRKSSHWHQARFAAFSTRVSRTIASAYPYPGKAPLTHENAPVMFPAAFAVPRYFVSYIGAPHGDPGELHSITAASRRSVARSDCGPGGDKSIGCAHQIKSVRSKSWQRQ